MGSHLGYVVSTPNQPTGGPKWSRTHGVGGMTGGPQKNIPKTNKHRSKTSGGMGKPGRLGISLGKKVSLFHRNLRDETNLLFFCGELIHWS